MVSVRVTVPMSVLSMSVVNLFALGIARRIACLLVPVPVLFVVSAGKLL